jgi:hypothetical protein
LEGQIFNCQPVITYLSNESNQVLEQQSFTFTQIPYNGTGQVIEQIFCPIMELTKSFVNC